jgi:hypothetical protein
VEFLLAVILPIAILAGCLVAIRVVRNKQRNGEIGNMAPIAYGELMIPGHDPADGVSVEHHVEQVDDRPNGLLD